MKKNNPISLKLTGKSLAKFKNPTVSKWSTDTDPTITMTTLTVPPTGPAARVA